MECVEILSYRQKDFLKPDSDNSLGRLAPLDPRICFRLPSNDHNTLFRKLDLPKRAPSPSDIAWAHYYDEIRIIYSLIFFLFFPEEFEEREYYLFLKG